MPPSKACKLLSALAAKAYNTAGQAASTLHIMAILQVHQVNALKLHEGSFDSWLMQELRMATDFALQATKVTAQYLGQVMSTMVVQEHHLLLDLAEICDTDKVCFVDSLSQRPGLFGRSASSRSSNFTVGSLPHHGCASNCSIDSACTEVVALVNTTELMLLSYLDSLTQSGSVYQYKVLPFKLSLSPCIFTKLVEGALSPFHSDLVLQLEVFTEDPRPEDPGPDPGPVQIRVYILNGQPGPGRVPIYYLGSRLGPRRVRVVNLRHFSGLHGFGSHFQIKYGSGSVPCNKFTGLFGFGYKFLDPLRPLASAPQLSGALGKLGEEQDLPCAEHLFSWHGVGCGHHMQWACSLRLLEGTSTAVAHQLPLVVSSAAYSSPVSAVATGQSVYLSAWQCSDGGLHQPPEWCTLLLHVIVRLPSSPLESDVAQIGEWSRSSGADSGKPRCTGTQLAPGFTQVCLPPVNLLAQTLCKIRKVEEQVLLVVLFGLPEPGLSITCFSHYPLPGVFLGGKTFFLRKWAVIDIITQPRAPFTRQAYIFKWGLFVEWRSSHQEDARLVYIAAIAAHHDAVDGSSLGKHHLTAPQRRKRRRYVPHATTSNCTECSAPQHKPE
ncbi:Non-reducing polyketide synthase ZEA1 [Labeo rohita]|uniref:Non-reducing polyketide synthase ZEA1 n=1 Tax=Labeo rohita TaxID=84645 RepID=A0ABQ8N2D7_LABRO|nr:Non-reducing polyketide synthase ZEA1 [Labeo rohita]